MSRSSRGARPRWKVALALTGVLGATALTATLWGANASDNPDQSRGTYIVQVAGTPVAAYDGNVKGYPATRPQAGDSIDPKSADVKRYRGYLASRRASVLDKVPDAKKLYDLDNAFNGFAAELTGQEAAKLSSTPGVLRVWKNEIRKLDTTTTSKFLGLSGKGGVWDKQFAGDEHAGEGVVVGVIDSGFWPENPAFAALPEPRPDAKVIAKKWNGTCDQGKDADARNNIECNNKVIGARYYGKGVKPIADEFDSPRDFGGHGSHTASTAAGNGGVDAVIAGKSRGTMSGMAPASRLAVYKACWEVEGEGGCGTVDLVAAIDQAVEDGVDVINYSISGTTAYIVDPVEIAFFNAARSGVFVSASAGNSGPGESTVAHNSPWDMTVAASTHDRAYKASVALGDGTTVNGAGLGEALPETDLVLSKDAGATDKAELCGPKSLDAAKVKGKLVACARGEFGRTEKSDEVKRAGGVGMVLYNVSPEADDIAADYHAVPSVHVNVENGKKVVAYAGKDGAKAALSKGEQYTARAPEMAAFSSAGPALAGGGDLLKPDITAPGVDVIAAVAPPGNLGEDFASYQGTSMSSPHVAGLGALLKSKHPKWKPTWIKSALMTTAAQTDNNGKPIQRSGKTATPFDFGSGHVAPAKAMNPGLVYESGPEDWIAYMCAIGQGQLVDAPCDAVKKTDPSDLNYPSIAVGDLAGSQTVVRTVKNVSSRVGTYTAKVAAPAGFSVDVKPRALVLGPGKSAKVKVKITRKDAAFGEYASGSLTWKAFGGGSDVRSPIVVQPVPVSAPSELSLSGASGSKQVDLKSGYSGTLSTTVSGLVPDTVKALDLKNPDGSAFDPTKPATNDHVGKVTVEVPKGSALARFATFDKDYADLGQGTDIDLYVFKKTADGPEFVGNSAAEGSEESVTLGEAGTYEIYVDLFALPEGQTSASVKHHSWVSGKAAGNLAVSPESLKVTSGKGAKLTTSWKGLEAGKTYLGALLYDDGEALVGGTVVTATP